MRIDVNINKAEGGKFDLLPVGDYKVEVTAWKQDKSAAGPFIRWTLKPIDEDLPEGNFGNLFIKTWLHPEALWVVKKLFVALGFEWAKDGSFDPEDVIGYTCTLPVIHGANEETGQVYANIDNRGTFLPSK